MSDARNEATSSHDHLIARLRSAPPYMAWSPVIYRAADAIEELRAENERLKALIEAIAIARRGEGEQGEHLQALEFLPIEIKGMWDIINSDAEYIAACGGLSPEAVEWAIRIAAELMAEWEEGSTHADTYYIVEAWWRSCPPEVRAQITGVET